MSMIQAAARAAAEKKERQQREMESPTRQGGSQSPVKTVMGALAPKPRYPSEQPKKGNGKGDHLIPLPPESIEDVPFRRQDRRILNARKKRIMDRKLIACQVLTGIVLVLVGVLCIVLWWQLKNGTFGRFV